MVSILLLVDSIETSSVIILPHGQTVTYSDCMYVQAGVCYAFGYVFHAIIRQNLTLRKIGIFGCQGAGTNSNELKTAHLVRAYYDYSDSAGICQ